MTIESDSLLLGMLMTLQSLKIFEPLNVNNSKPGPDPTEKFSVDYTRILQCQKI